MNEHARYPTLSTVQRLTEENRQLKLALSRAERQVLSLTVENKRLRGEQTRDERKSRRGLTRREKQQNVSHANPR